MSSVHVRNDKNDVPSLGQPRTMWRTGSRRPSVQTSHPGGFATLQGTNSSTANGAESSPGPPLLHRHRRPSRVADHVMSTARRIPSASATRSPETPHAGPSHGHGRPHLHDHANTYSIHGRQTELRVPTDDDQGLQGSQVSLALNQLADDDSQDSASVHHNDIVDILEVIDTRISTIGTLTNTANAIVVPPLSFYSRKPVVVLPAKHKKKKAKAYDPEKGTSHEESEDALDQHVEDVLRKRDKFRRAMQGVWTFVKTPLGFITAIYGFLVVFWGTGIVFFLAKFINLHNDITQGFWVELCQQVETGLFTATSIGFIPFRIMDTYRICKIWRYKRKIARLRQKAGLPELYDPDDLPDPVYDPNYVQVLTDKEQIDLHYQQHQFMKSQTWYRPHGTPTHRAFPMDLALWICVCNDLNSFFQCLLSGTMWGLDRFQRPAWTTGTTLPAAFIAGIIAGVLIYWGGRKTRRTEEVEQRLRTALEMDNDSAVAVEMVGENPERMLTAQASPISRAGASRSPASVEQGIVKRDAQNGMQAMGDRMVSSRSVRSAEETMVVPPAEELP